MLDKEAVATARQGGGSETTLTGRVVDADGKPVSGVAVRIRLEGDLPPNLFSADSAEATDLPLAYTDPDGTFRLPGRTSGSYFVECRSNDDGAALLRAEIAAQDTLHLPDAVLQPTGAIKGRLAGAMDTEAFPVPPISYVYIPGLWKRDIADGKNGFTFLLKDLPAGRYTLRIQPSFLSGLAQSKIMEIPDVEVRPGDTLDLDSLAIAKRTGLQDPAYSRDSLAVFELYKANLSPDQTPDPHWVESSTGVIGNRITMLLNFPGEIHKIPDAIQSLDALEVIYLAGPTYSPSDIEISAEISRLPHLRRLWLYGYDLSHLPAWTGTFPELTSLALVRVDKFPDWILNLVSLTSLDLVTNGLEGLPKDFTRLRNLRVLDLGGNGLRTLPPQLMAMKSLQGVSLRGNRLCSTTAEEKAWISRQDSLWIAQEDPLMYMPNDKSWEETQQCGP
jgi:hypothetical protein